MEKIDNRAGKKRFLIIGLNDSQGVDTTFRIDKKSCMYYIEKEFIKRKENFEMFDCFSLFFNKTHYVESFFKHNIDKKSIRDLQIRGNIKALKKCMIDNSFPAFISYIRNIYRLTYPKVNRNMNLTAELVSNVNPFVIYSSGANDLMRAVGTDPFSVLRHYRIKDYDPHFDYSLNQAGNHELIDGVINMVKKNFELIKSYNSSVVIFALGLYIPTSLEQVEMKPFCDMIIEYNTKLKKLCHECGVVYIDTNDIGKKYSRKKYSFHISTRGHKELSKILIQNIDSYSKRINSNEYVSSDNYDDGGVVGVIGDIKNMFEDYKNSNINNDIFRVKEIEKEFIDELEVLSFVNNG